MSYSIKEIGETYKPYFVITENGKELNREQVAELYKPLQYYPFSNAGWAYYHLFQLKIRQGIAAKELSVKVCKPTD